MEQFDLSDPERAALDWALGELGWGPAVAPPPLASTFNEARQSMLRRLSRYGPFTLGAVTSDEGMITAALRNAKAQTFQLKLKLEGGSLLFVVFGLLPPDGFRLREIGENETDKIAALERDSPIELDDGRSFAIYRPRLGDYLRLQERTWRALIERDAEPVAARVFAGRTLNLRGRPVAFATSQIARVLPSMRGFNLMRCFGLWSGVAVGPNIDRMLAYVDLGNQIVNAAFRNEDLMWKGAVLELTFTCASLAGQVHGRIATRADAARLAALANLAHGRAALYGALDERTFAQKLERAPEVYSWRDVLLSEHAMLGVWASLDETTDSAPGHAPKRRTLSMTLDYGFEGNAGLQELLPLLRAQASRVQGAGATHLTLYTCPGAPAAELLTPFAEDRATISVQSALPEPADADGVYTDPLYI